MGCGKSQAIFLSLACPLQRDPLGAAKYLIFRPAFLHHFLICRKTSTARVSASLLQLGCPVACPACLPWAARWVARWAPSSPALPPPGAPEVWGEQPSWRIGGTGQGRDGFGIGGGSGWEPWGLGLAGLPCPACCCPHRCPHRTPIRLASFCQQEAPSCARPNNPSFFLFFSSPVAGVRR